MSDAKSFSSSRTVQWSGLLAAVAVAFGSLPSMIASMPDVAADPAVKSLIAMMPASSQHIIALILGFIAVINVVLRLRTSQPIAPPKLPPTNSTLICMLLLAALPTIVGCSSTQLPKMPDAASISTPDQADEAWYIAVKTYYIATGAVNTLHEHQKISDTEYARLVSSVGSVAWRARAALQAAEKGIQLWRTGGDKAAFADQWQKYAQELDALRAVIR